MSKLNTELKDQLAVVISDPDNGLVEIGEKKSEAARLILACVDGPCEGETIEWIGWLTDNAFEKTLEKLQEVFQFDGNFGEFAADRDLFANRQCRFTSEFEEYKGKTRLKVKWLNAVDGGGGGAPTLDPVKAKSLASKLTARAKALTKAAGQPAAAPAAKKENKPGDGGEDDIPY